MLSARRKRDCEGLISLCTIGMLQRSKRKKQKLEKRLIEFAKAAKIVKPLSLLSFKQYSHTLLFPKRLC